MHKIWKLKALHAGYSRERNSQRGGGIYILLPTLITAYINKPYTHAHTGGGGGRRVEKTAARLPLLMVARTLNSCATTSLFPMFYIRMAAHFEGEILYS
jgi:hypothetical protein